MGLQLKLIGRMSLRRNGVELVLHGSRKLKGLLAYLALSPKDGYMRSHLVRLLWGEEGEVLDRYSELRWVLSKLYKACNEPGPICLFADRERVRMDRSIIQVDAMEIQTAMQAGLETLGVDRLRELAAMFEGDLLEGDLLEGLVIQRCAHFSNWLLAQRRRMRAHRIAILKRLAQSLPAGDEAIACLETCLQIDPLDKGAHGMMLELLARMGKFREGEEHLSMTARIFESENLEWYSIGMVWRKLRAQSAPQLLERLRWTQPENEERFYKEIDA